MPRIYTSASDPIDFCSAHFPKSEQQALRYANTGDGPDGRGNCFAYDAEHPDYEGEGYRCAACGKTLRDMDN